MDAYMLRLNLRARGVEEHNIQDALLYGNVIVPSKRGAIEVIKRGNWYYFL